MIESLTPEQEARLQECNAENIRIKKNTNPLDRTKVEEVINKIYILHHQRECPVVLYYDSPVHAITELRMNYPDETFVWGDFYHFPDHNSTYLTYEFMMEIGIKFDETGEENTNFIKTYAQGCRELSWWASYENAAVVIERPVTIEMKKGKGNSLMYHCETGPALEWKDGTRIFLLNGELVPEYLVMTPSDELDVEWYNAQTNINVRREFVKKFGKDRLISFGVTIDAEPQIENAEVV